MAVNIPRRKLEASPDEVLVQRDSEAYAFLRKIDPFQTAAKINASEYALIPEGNTANSAISMKQTDNGSQYLPTQHQLLIKGLVGATPARLISTIREVNAAVSGRGVVYDASGNLIEGERLKQYAHTLNHDCWVWLNAQFPREKESGTGHKGLDIVTIIGLDGKGQPILKREPLQPCLEDNCFAELESANPQGLFTRKSQVQKYEPGKTAYNWPAVLRQDKPDEEGYVAGFYAYSDGAYLGCYGHPDDSYPSLGVFACAEGAVAKNEGGK